MGKRSKLYDMPKEDIQKVCDSSPSLRQAALKLNVHYEVLRRVCEEREIDLSTLNSNRHIKHDLTNQKFGNLTVLELDKDKGREKQAIYWKCMCDCENHTIVSVLADSLLGGKTISCGCIRKQRAWESRKKYNIYDLSSEYGIGYTTNNNTPFYFDKEDYDLIKNYAWKENPTKYISTNIGDKSVFLHRFVMRCEDKNKEIDHINHKPNDNRKCNLRECTRQENACNVKTPKTNTSGHIGVRLTSSGKWNARIKVNQKEYYLGNYENFEDAVKAREEAEIKYFKEFRYKGDVVDE